MKNVRQAYQLSNLFTERKYNKLPEGVQAGQEITIAFREEKKKFSRTGLL